MEREELANLLYSVTSSEWMAGYLADRLLPFVRAKVDAERERCTSIAESRRSEVTFGTSEYLVAGEIAAAIRAVEG